MRSVLPILAETVAAVAALAVVLWAFAPLGTRPAPASSPDAQLPWPPGDRLPQVGRAAHDGTADSEPGAIEHVDRIAETFGAPATTFAGPDHIERVSTAGFSVTGRLVIDGQLFWSAVDRSVGRAVLIGPSRDVADWLLVEEQEAALVVDTGDERLLIQREMH